MEELITAELNESLKAEADALRRHNARLEQDVERLLSLDQLTGLLNRSAFINRVDSHFRTLAADAPQGAMIEIGIGGLPRITGSLGRHVGDYMVSALAARLNAMTEQRNFCCRLDYRSFAVFYPAVGDPLEALTSAKQLIGKLSEAVDWVDRKLTLNVGAGVALSSATDRDAATLLQNAGLAHKAATEKGGPGYGFYNPALAQLAKRKADILVAVQDALEDQLLSLHYQPIFNIQSAELIGFEALLRLNHPTLGNISPTEFIPVAEEAGLVGKLGGWAMAEACRAAATWPNHLTVAVNVSPEQFNDGSLLTDVHNALELSSFPAYRLEVEITESTMMGDAEIVSSQVLALQSMGCSIVLDDFGTGYSSLSYLWKFPFSKIKIDRSFMQAMDKEPRVRGMLSSIMDLSRNLGMKVTAEGIETEAQARVMQDIKCDFMQGYLCGRPTPASGLAAIIMTRFAESLRKNNALQIEALPLAPTQRLGGE